VSQTVEAVEKNKNGKKEAVGGQSSFLEYALVSNPKSGFPTVLLGGFGGPPPSRKLSRSSLHMLISESKYLRM
jgi:hypothetical protein